VSRRAAHEGRAGSGPNERRIGPGTRLQAMQLVHEAVGVAPTPTSSMASLVKIRLQIGNLYTRSVATFSCGRIAATSEGIQPMGSNLLTKAGRLGSVCVRDTPGGHERVNLRLHRRLLPHGVRALHLQPIEPLLQKNACVPMSVNPLRQTVCGLQTVPGAWHDRRASSGAPTTASDPAPRVDPARKLGAVRWTTSARVPCHNRRLERGDVTCA
jgi:hypothetical protein